ncbi:hypothetical protein R1sor_018767 [Riccia sorocarpa]|uniref:Synaptotagmin-2 n=1 Tax=Riccia sorocarpa TaxID=122646 RepID=A0ABD3IED1_9MARC
MAVIGTIFTICGVGVGVVLGLVAGFVMFIYFEPDDVKDPRVRSVLELDKQALENLLPEIPLWVKNPDQEKVDWLNTFLDEMWPYLNKAVCKTIRSTAEPYITTYKSQYKLDSVEFLSLTLGTLPPTFVGMKVYETADDEMIFEVSIKWAGNPNIKLGVKAYGLKVTAQIVDFQLFLTARITMKPFVDVFPCFSNIHVSLMEKPHVDFGLKLLNADLMAIPGLHHFVQDYVKQMVASMYLWPKTYDIPILDTALHKKEPQGMLSVTVVKAHHLKNKDLLGKSDPYVMLRVGDSTRQTKTIMNNLNPEWNETLNIPVDDPDTESLDITVYDWDKVGSHDKLGIQVIQLKDLVPEQQQTFSLNLVKNLDPNDSSNQKNRGQITLELNYKPFKLEHHDLPEHHDSDDNEDGESTDTSPLVSKVPSKLTGPLVVPPGGGLLVVIIHYAEDLEGKHHTNPYVKITFRGEQRRTKAIKKSRDPRWDEEFEYTLEDPPHNDRLLLEVCSKSKNLIHSRETLGRVEIDLSDVVRNKRLNEKYQLWDSKSGKIQVELQWRSTGTVSRHFTIQDPSIFTQGYNNSGIY